MMNLMVSLRREWRRQVCLLYNHPLWSLSNSFHSFLFLFQEMSKRSRSNRGSSSRSQQENLTETVASWNVFDNDDTNFKYNQLLHHQIDHGAVVDWELLRSEGLEQGFLDSFQTDDFTGPSGKGYLGFKSQSTMNWYVSFWPLFILKHGRKGVT